MHMTRANHVERTSVRRLSTYAVNEQTADAEAAHTAAVRSTDAATAAAQAAAEDKNDDDDEDDAEADRLLADAQQRKSMSE